MKSERQEPRIALTCAGVGCCACAASNVSADTTRAAPAARLKIGHNSLMPKSFHALSQSRQNAVAVQYRRVDISPLWTAFSGAARPDKPDPI